MSFLGWLTSTAGSLCVLSALLAVAVLLLIWDHRRGRPAPGPEAAAAAAGPHRDPPAPRLTPAEQAALAALAVRYAHADPRAGRMLADYLRTRCPGVSDLDLMRCVVALGNAARYFQRHGATEADAFAHFLHAAAGAALDLTELETSPSLRETRSPDDR